MRALGYSGKRKGLRMIPNTIHFIWMTKEAARIDDPIPDEVRDQIFRWHHHAADCAIRCWGWAEFEALERVDPAGWDGLQQARTALVRAAED